ncbi:Protein transport protein Sec23A [Bonamia ostreae]|uniref:Protein transport protein SEC23 n=1 Tax=Bonamia ostreae TaxID=126728 RepID=A0ABV2AQ92_9EUKA
MQTRDGFMNIKTSFDQGAACVLMARWAVYKAENEFAPDIFRWLDSTLIKLIKTFSSYEKNHPETFRLSSEFSFYPQFMFYLRRSPFMSIFNSSPDETAYYRIILNRENLLNSITMIQPPLFSYNMGFPNFVKFKNPK